MRVLVVDDSQIMRRMLTHTLRQLGASEVIQAESANQAMKLLDENFTVDLILTDWHMPGMSGLELLKYLRSWPRYKNTPVIMSTSESAGENVVLAIRAGATNYLIKPFTKVDLAEKVTPYLHSLSIGPGDRPAASGRVIQTGVLRKGDLGAVLQFLMHSRRTGCCEIETDTCSAAIFLIEGRISGASYQLQKKEAAFFTCFQVPLKLYRFCETDTPCPPGCEIRTPGPALLIEAARRFDHSTTGPLPNFLPA